MSQFLIRLQNIGRRSIATTAHPQYPEHHHHPNPGNFANRPRAELSEIGHHGGKKGGKARGGFHDMDPEKQHAIASKGGRAAKKAVIEQERAAREVKRQGRSFKPSVVPPGFEEWKTCA
ncbi:hypothetical protein N7510_004878 [Penicillium lagena]|uniref:uncharacterized protein n=1 Tax=Penicillium lagena TaxID=94218 RepID=UPI0025423BD7|nr:uncharacterized protein N7510_004878 [Penicillium lagena]KAJ5620894.1 hypothetical protein N7510_004878 [Penicillium lagena]